MSAEEASRKLRSGAPFGPSFGVGQGDPAIVDNTRVKVVPPAPENRSCDMRICHSDTDSDFSRLSRRQTEIRKLELSVELEKIKLEHLKLRNDMNVQRDSVKYERSSYASSRSTKDRSVHARPPPSVSSVERENRTDEWI